MRTDPQQGQGKGGPVHEEEGMMGRLAKGRKWTVCLYDIWRGKGFE
jgi:hypothetical protein